MVMRSHAPTIFQQCTVQVPSALRTGVQSEPYHSGGTLPLLARQDPASWRGSEQSSKLRQFFEARTAKRERTLKGLPGAAETEDLLPLTRGVRWPYTILEMNPENLIANSSGAAAG